MTETPASNLAPIMKAAARIEEDTLYSAKSQWESARELGWLHLALGIPATVAAALAGVSIVAEDKTLGAVLSGASAVLTALLTFLDPKSKASLHRQAGSVYKAISNDARLFREVKCSGGTSSGPVLEEAVEKLTQRLNEANAGAPQPTRWAFSRARKGIEAGEAMYKADAVRRSRQAT